MEHGLFRREMLAEKNIKTVLCCYSDTTACGRYRVIDCYSDIKSDIKFIVSNDLSDAWLHKTGNDMVNACLLQRPSQPLQLRFLREFKAEGGIVVVDTDDDLLHIPASNPVFQFIKEPARTIYSDCLKECDYVHVTTPELCLGEKYVVFPNAINLKKYNHPLSKRNRSVMWSGSTTHSDSLELIKPVIYELANNGVDVILMSDREWLNSIFKPHKNIIFEDWTYFELSHLLASRCDVFLTPLPKNVFNSKKSELKVLEAAAWKVPCVSSDVAPYRRFNDVSKGGNVLVKKERTKDWLEAIYSLLDNPVKLKEHGEKSYLCVQQVYNLETVNKKRVEWWSKILKEQKTS